MLLIHGTASTPPLCCLNEVKCQGRWGEAETHSASHLSKDVELWGVWERDTVQEEHLDHAAFSVGMCVFYNWWNDTNLTAHFSGHVSSTPKCTKYSSNSTTLNVSSYLNHPTRSWSQIQSSYKCRMDSKNLRLSCSLSLSHAELEPVLRAFWLLEWNGTGNKKNKPPCQSKRGRFAIW